MLEFYQQLAQVLEQGSAVLATITHTKGSVPREVGAKMVVCSDGRIIGTIGGGAGEAKVISQALQVLETGEKRFVEIDLSGSPHREMQGVCGGMMQLWLERWQGESALTLVHQILDVLKSSHSGTLVTPFEPDQLPYLQLPFQATSFNSPFQKGLGGSADETTLHELPQLTSAGFVEPLLCSPTLLIIGAGHVAVPLAKIAHLAGFRIIVQDDRPEFACLQRFPEATAILAQPIALALSTLTKTTQLYVALVTRGYSHDLEALRMLLQRQLKYIGMIGSEKRVRTVYQLLQQEGTQLRSLDNIYAPIGLDIGALTPEEIAVSICAELIKVRRGGTGQSLSERLRSYSNASVKLHYVQPSQQH